MKKIIMTLLLSLALSADSFKDMTLIDFTELVSSYTDNNFYLDEDINKSLSLFVPSDLNGKDLIKLLELSLKKNDYNLKKLNNNYYIEKKKHFLPENFNFSYKLKYNTSEDCKTILDFHHVKYKYLKDTSTFLLSAKISQYNEILPLLQQTDIKKKQVTLKITIFEFSNDELKEKGLSSLSLHDKQPLNISTSSSQSQASFPTTVLNGIFSPVTNSTITFKSYNFNYALSLLDSHNLIDIKQSPFILARNNDKFQFYAVDNIPFKTSSTTTQAANLSTNESIEYKDVGLKIDGIAFIYDDYVSLDLSLVVEDIISQSPDNIPQTYKRQLNSLSNVSYGDVLLLSGLKRTKKNINDYSVPYLSNIPYLGELFKYKKHSHEYLDITIAIEVIDPMGS